MAQVRAIKNFPGSTINRDELGVVTEGQELEVSSNDAAFLEREELVERIEEPVAAEGGAATGEPAGGSSDPEPKGKAPAGTGKQQKQD